MKISRQSINKIRMFIVVIMFSMAGGSIFSYLIAEEQKLYFAIAGAFVGFTGGLLSYIFEEGIRYSIFFRKKINLSTHIILRTFYYLVVFGILIFLIMFLGERDRQGIDTAIGIVTNQGFSRGILFAFIFSLVITFFLELIKLIGKNSLINFFTGQYHKPKIENRIIMFLDINSSTTIAEKIGHKRFHEFLNDFFFDISPVIENHKGEIYKYVGDEIIVTWKEKHGVKKNNCVACIKEIYKLINKKKKLYNKNYGFVPYFKSGFHYGEVVIGEMGDIKKEIVYLGDVVNTTARIQEKCKDFNKYALFSGNIVNLIEDNTKIFNKLETVSLRGKEEQIELYSLE